MPREREDFSYTRRRENSVEGKGDVRSLTSRGPRLSTEPRAGDERRLAGRLGDGAGSAGWPFLEVSCLLLTYSIHFDCKYGFAFPNGRVG